MKIPYIDGLAAKGTHFDRAYLQFPLGSKNRSSIMTGLHLVVTKVCDLKKYFRSVLPDVVTLGRVFHKTSSIVRFFIGDNRY